jgi:NADH-quinone oxidoreductase subunit M
MPGLGNFVGEFLILLGTFKAWPLLSIIAATGLILAAVYSLIIMQRAFFGPTKSDEPLIDLNLREMALVGSLMIILVWLGLYPQPLLDTTASVMDNVLQIYTAKATP